MIAGIATESRIGTCNNRHRHAPIPQRNARLTDEVWDQAK